jgi:CheY-like chemotaxis protein
MSSPSSNNASDKAASTLARQQSTITAILDKLDAADGSKFRNRRESPRYLFRRIDVPVRVFHPGGTDGLKLVATRNLSNVGLGFLCTGFLHIGTKVETMLTRRTGGDDVIVGKVIFCVHVSGSFHQIGVRFDQKIAPRSYVDRASLEKLDRAGLPPTTLGGHVLHVDDSEVERKLLAHYLKPTKITLTSIPSGDDPIAAVKASNVDLVLCEANLKAMTGEQLIAQLRTAGYAGRVIVITSETKGDRLRALKQAGATGMLGKPYDQAKLFSLIGAFLKRVAADTGVVSALAAQPEMKSLIERYVANVQQLAKDIEAAMRENQIDRIRHICNSLKGSGTSYGFAVLSDSAKETMRALDATMSMQESDEQIKKLLDLCKRVIIR